MNIVVLSTSPNRDGLTAACARSALEGARDSGIDAREIRINDAGIGLCRACNDGWGTCRSTHECQVQDGFQAVHADVCGADAVVLVTPVYWGEMSESAKAFTDRLRRCEATAGVQSRMAGTPIILVAAAGGSGNGTVSCLESMERFAKAVGTRQFDIVSVNRWNREYKIRTIRDSTAAMSGELARK